MAIPITSPLARWWPCAGGCPEGVLLLAVAVPLEGVFGTVLGDSDEDEDEKLLKVLLAVMGVAIPGGTPCDPVVTGLTYPVCDERPISEQ